MPPFLTPAPGGIPQSPPIGPASPVPGLAQRLGEPADFDAVFRVVREAVRRVLAPGGLVYAEGRVPLDAGHWAARGLDLVRSGRAGAVHFHLLRARPC